MSRKIRVVLVEDSVTQREVIGDALEAEGDIEVVASCRSGREGLERTVALLPDLVMTDVWMPEMDGLAMIRGILAEVGLPIIAVTATVQKRDLDLAFECWAAGAVHLMEKPVGAALHSLKELGSDLRRAVRFYSKIQVKKQKFRDSPADRPVALIEQPVHAIGIVSSTGGPPVLLDILSSLPENYLIPIFVVQHLSDGFDISFVEWIREKLEMPVRMAASGQAILPGVYFCPNGRHMIISPPGDIHLEPPLDGDLHVPSGNRLLGSLAAAYGKAACGVILTGMGEDGVDGLGQIRLAGGQTVAQDRETALIWGMAGRAVERGVVRRQMTPKEIAQWMASLPGVGRP